MSVVQGNTITDATDGGIVLFGTPGVLVNNNTVISVNRQLLGGINMVDYSPWSGQFVNTNITNNFLYAKTNLIKVGIAGEFFASWHSSFELSLTLNLTTTRSYA